MHRLIIFSSLLALAVAQNGYDYNRPGKPFGNRPAGGPSRPGNTYLAPGTTPALSPTGFSGNGPTTNQGYPTNGPTTNQGYPTDGSTPAQGYPTTGQGYPTPTGPQGIPTGPGGTQYPGTGQTDIGYTGANDRTGQSGYNGQAAFPGSTAPAGDFSNGKQNQDGQYEGGDYSAIPGEPERDYPILSEIPSTSFRCSAQAYPGYYADVETRCQVFHVCANNRTFDFLCPNGTIFSQQVFVCVWWNQFDCDSAPSLYDLNANLYDYSITGAKTQESYGAPGFTGPSGNGLTPYGGSDGNQGSTGYPGGQDYSNTGVTGAGDYNTGRGSTSFSNGSQRGGSGTFPSTGTTPGLTTPGSRSGGQNIPSGGQGYPSGQPSGPSFPSAPGYPAPPNREYLPPRN